MVLSYLGISLQLFFSFSVCRFTQIMHALPCMGICTYTWVKVCIRTVRPAFAMLSLTQLSLCRECRQAQGCLQKLFTATSWKIALIWKPLIPASFVHSLVSHHYLLLRSPEFLLKSIFLSFNMFFWILCFILIHIIWIYVLTHIASQS